MIVLKRVLIISPYFPPSNAADMQRVRMSLPFFKQYGWDAEVVMVNEQHSDILKDNLLLQSISPDIKIHKVGAFSKNITSKIGLGSLALRSLWYYLKEVNSLLDKTKYDLIYFSTTQFPVTILGNYWKKKFNIPYIIDIQDPWHSDYYKDKPKGEQPPKYWFSYRLNKYLEPIAMKQLDGIISVSEGYIYDLKTRYPLIKDIPAVTIPFGAFNHDLSIAVKNEKLFKPILQPGFKNIVYIGRGGADMHSALSVAFAAFKSCIQINPDLFRQIRLYFIGTSYAAAGQGKQTILPLAKQFGIEENVIEITDRISYYHTLSILQHADALFIPGSDDPNYTASKIYPYLLTQKTLLALFNSKSPALKVLDEYVAPFAYRYDDDHVQFKIADFFKTVALGETQIQHYDTDAIKKYSAENMTRQQCLLFDTVLK